MDSFQEPVRYNDRKLFDEMMSYPRLYNAAGMGACRPVLIQPMLMSTIFEHYKRLKKINLQENLS
jgi:hypothetical protein